MMDLALRGVRTGWRLYLGFVLSGVAANLLALGSRAANKLLGFDLTGARPFDSWWLQAIGTYTLSGVVAGLLGALCWFHLNDRRREGTRA
jgi:membrane associated rhomboid family serine protease